MVFTELGTNSVILKDGWQLLMRKWLENRSKPVKKHLTSRLSPERRSRAPKWRGGQGLSNFSDPLVSSPESDGRGGFCS